MTEPSLPASFSLAEGPFAARLVAEAKALTEFNPSRYETRQSEDELKTDLELTCVDCGTVLCDVEAGDQLDVLLNVAREHHCSEPETCGFCQHPIRFVNGGWVATDADGDDSIWRESCPDNHTERAAPHEPEEA